MKHLLLDFDGVILRNKQVDTFIKGKSRDFVKMHSKAIDDRHYKQLRKDWLPMHKHTHVMVNKMFNKNISLYEYQDFMFRPREYSKLVTNFTQEDYEEATHIKKLFAFCKANDIPWNIFTNASIDWVLIFAYSLGIDLREKDVIWPNNNDANYLKPFHGAYQRVEEMFPDTSQFVFVDDTKMNLKPIMGSLKWKPMLMHPSYDTSLMCTRVQRVLEK